MSHHRFTWRGLFLGLALLALIALIDGQSVLGVAEGAPLLPQDHSILWPLKFSKDKDEVFKSEGDGFCNAPNLVKDKVLDLELFRQITQQAFNSQQSGITCEPNTKFQDLGLELSPTALLSQKIPLILVKGVAPTVCDPALWHVVGLRADPCLNVASHLKAGEACQAQLRLVLQPFETSPIGLRVARDFSLHLVYTTNSWPELQKGLEALADVSRASETQKPWEPEFDGKRILRPHHGLRNELARCDGPVAAAAKKFVAAHATPSKLQLAAVMGSSLGVKEWTFSTFFVQGDGAQKRMVQAPLNGIAFDNFSDSLFTKGTYPLVPELLQMSTFPSIADQISRVAANRLEADDRTPNRRSLLFAEGQAILNPRRISQATTNCTSCHLAPQTLEALASLYGAQNPDVGVDTFRAEVWPGFNPKARSFIHLRNFGYGPQFNLSINRRTINESMLVQEWIEKKGKL